MSMDGPDAIIIVDNSGTLAAKLTSRSEIVNATVLTPDRNLGYLGGASWALEQYLSRNPLPQWVIVSNSDISFPDPQFFAKLRGGDRPPAAVVAPDTVSIERTLLPESPKHQNPFMLTRPSALRIRVLRFIARRYPIYLAYSLASRVRYLAIRALSSLLSWRRDGGLSSGSTIYAPFGGCFIFNESYFLAGGTLRHGAFLFGEELFVAETARNLKLKIIYDPSLVIAHDDHGATRLLPSRRLAMHTLQAIDYIFNTFFDRRRPLYTLQGLYERLPVPCQNIGISAVGYYFKKTRYGGQYSAKLQFLRESMNWPYEQLRDYQDERLRALVQIAYRDVPYYTQAFDRLGVHPADIRGCDDLRRLPVLTKNEVRENQSLLINRSLPRRSLVHDHTSGSTGTSLQLVFTTEAVEEQNAIWKRGRLRFEPIVSRATFNGRSIVPMRQTHPPFWRYNLPGCQMLFSIYHISEDTITEYYKKLASYKCDCIDGYPSALYLMADAMLSRGYRLPYKPVCVLTSAEVLSEHVALTLRTAFDCDVSDHYGLGEGVANASRCEYGVYHEDMEFCFHEYIPVDGVPDLYRLIGTGLANAAMPLMRYDTGDLVTLGTAPCACGRPGRVIQSFDGRCEAIIELSNGAKIGRLDHVFKDLQNIREAQIFQERPGAIRVSVVRRDGFTARDEAQLIWEFKKRLGDDLEIEIKYVEKVDRGPNGKIRFVISSISANQPWDTPGRVS
jgi:phenylacetate-CoA ligase